MDFLDDKKPLLQFYCRESQTGAQTHLKLVQGIVPIEILVFPIDLQGVLLGAVHLLVAEDGCLFLEGKAHQRNGELLWGNLESEALLDSQGNKKKT